MWTGKCRTNEQGWKMQDWKMQNKNWRTQKWTTNKSVSVNCVALDYVLCFTEEITVNNELQRIICRKKHRKHQLTSYVVQRIEYVRTVYRQLQFTSVRQFSRTASLSSGSANDIEDSRSPEPELSWFRRMQGNAQCSNVLFWSVRYIRYRRAKLIRNH